jgi:hypothetical protein
MATDSFLRAFKEEISAARGQNENPLGLEAKFVKNVAKRQLKKADGIIAAQQARLDLAEAAIAARQDQLDAAEAVIQAQRSQLEEADGKTISQRQEIERIIEESKLIKDENARMKKEMEDKRATLPSEYDEEDLMVKLDPSVSLNDDGFDEIPPESKVSWKPVP